MVSSCWLKRTMKPSNEIIVFIVNIAMILAQEVSRLRICERMICIEWQTVNSGYANIVLLLPRIRKKMVFWG